MDGLDQSGECYREYARSPSVKLSCSSYDEEGKLPIFSGM